MLEVLVVVYFDGRFFSRPRFDARYNPGMKSVSTILAIALVLLVPIGSYVGAYLQVGFKTTHEHGPVIVRVERLYRDEWLATFFAPAALVEAAIRGTEVRACTSESHTRQWKCCQP
jgi:hypothetical protein